MSRRLLLSCLLLSSPATAFLAPQTAHAFSRPAVSAAASSTAVPAVYKKVFVAGGSRGVGRCIIEQLLKQGVQVVAMVRNEAVMAELNAMEGVTAKLGDAFHQKQVENVMDGCDAAITTLGGSTSDETGKRVDYDGNSNVVESAGILGVVRVILVSSIGCGSSKEAAPPAVFEALKEVLDAKERAENVLIKYYTNTNWTIIRPGGLKSEPATGKAILTEDYKAIGSIHREDVAALVLQALESTNTERKILSAVDPSIESAVSPDGRVLEAFALA